MHPGCRPVAEASEHRPRDIPNSCLRVSSNLGQTPRGGRWVTASKDVGASGPPGKWLTGQPPVVYIDLYNSSDRMWAVRTQASGDADEDAGWSFRADGSRGGGSGKRPDEQLPKTRVCDAGGASSAGRPAMGTSGGPDLPDVDVSGGNHGGAGWICVGLSTYEFRSALRQPNGGNRGAGGGGPGGWRGGAGLCVGPGGGQLRSDGVAAAGGPCRRGQFIVVRLLDPLNPYVARHDATIQPDSA